MRHGRKVSTTTVGRLPHELVCRLQLVRNNREGTSNPNCNVRFEHINSKADDFLQRAQPVVPVDTRKKGLVGGGGRGGEQGTSSRVWNARALLPSSG